MLVVTQHRKVPEKELSAEFGKHPKQRKQNTPRVRTGESSND